MKWLVMLSLVFGANCAHAVQDTQPLLRGSYQKIIKAHTGKPFVVALWSLTCTHCGADLHLFQQLAKKYGDFNLVLISTDVPEQKTEITRTLQNYHLLETKPNRAGKIESWVFADSYIERLRFEIDAQWYGELPRTYFFDAKGNVKGVSGVLDENETEQWVKANP